MAETDPKAEENNEGGEKKKLSLSTPVLIAIAGGLLVVIIVLIVMFFFFRSPDTPPPEDEVAIEQQENAADGQDVEAPLVIMPATSATNAVVAATTSQIPTQALSTASSSLPDAGNTPPPPADSPLANAEQIVAGFIAMQQQLSALREENENLKKQVLELKADFKYKDEIIHRREVRKALDETRSKQKFEPKLDIKLEPKWGIPNS